MSDTTVLYLNNITSFTVVMTCWWLAHMYSIASRPYGRLIASCYGLFGLGTTGAAIARNLDFSTEVWAIIVKLLATALFVAIAFRLHRKYDIT